MMEIWRDQTTDKATFYVKSFPGDHFYVQSKEIVPKIVKEVSDLLEKVKRGDIPHNEVEEKTFVDEDIVRKINLLDILQEDHPDKSPPPEDCTGKFVACAH